MKTSRVVSIRMALASAALGLASGVAFMACGGGQGPIAPAPVTGARSMSEPGVSATGGGAAASGQMGSGRSCEAPKTTWCHVPDGQGPIEICIDSAGVADHQRHPNDSPIKTWYEDRDGDGYGAGPGRGSCLAPDGYVDRSGDCNDDDAAVNPGATEACDGADNDCDGQADEGAVCPCGAICDSFDLTPSPFFIDVEACVTALSAAAETRCCSGVLNAQGGFVFGTDPAICRGFCGSVEGSCIR